jgi:hypothetical protein
VRSLPKEIPTRKIPSPPDPPKGNQVPLRVFANVPPPITIPLPTTLGYYADIVFALQNNTTNPGLQVRSLAIKIPVANLSPPSKFSNTTTVSLLTQSYDGPGPIMLSNQRFNATLGSEYSADSGQNYLLINILPRSFSGLVIFDDNPDFSCLLRQVAIDGSTRGNVPFTLLEGYTLASGEAVDVETTFPIVKT